MEGCLAETVRALRGLSGAEIGEVLRRESAELEVTKSLLSVLFNVCLTKAVPLSHRLKREFSAHSALVVELLSGADSRVNKTAGLQAKRRLLIRNPQLVRLVAEACPRRPSP